MLRRYEKQYKRTGLSPEKGEEMEFKDLIEKDKENTSHKLDLEYFLNLPRRAQELLFLCMCNHHNDNPLSILSFGYEYKMSPIEIIFDIAHEILKYENLVNPAFEFCHSTQINSTIKINNKKYVPDFLYVYDFFDDAINILAYEYAIENPEATEYKTYKYSNENLKVVIECDGHDFHEKTKEQVKRDNERQLALQMAGYDVIRFSGSQIYNEPFQCVKAVYDFIEKKIGDKIEYTAGIDKLNEYRERYKKYMEGK